MNATRTRTHTRTGRRLKAIGLGIALGLALGTPVQADVDIANVPLFLTASVDPNIMFVIDDSGSMMFETLPDNNGLNIFVNATNTQWWNRMVTFVYPQRQTTGTATGVTFEDCIYTDGTNTECDYWRHSTYRDSRLHLVPRFETDNRWAAYFRSSNNNLSYYNPTVRYRPWADEDGNDWPAATPTAAPHNPARPGKGNRDLTNDNTQRACWVRHTASTASSNANLCDTGNLTFYPATYFQYNSGDVQNPASYTRIEIRPANAPFTGGADRTDCATPTACAYNEEIQNFANWYTYYRSRVLSARAGIGRAFSEQGENLRVGFGAINKASTSIDGANTRTIIRGVRPFSGTHRSDFFDHLYNDTIPLAGTPLRRALDDAGQYYSRTANAGPWGETPGTNDGTPQLSCRQSFTILMTDGYWNGDEAGTDDARHNNDGTNGPTIPAVGDTPAYTYSAVSPYTDGEDDTLADVAMYYWKRDLHTDLANNVPPTKTPAEVISNPAYWQHMVTFGVGLGVEGTVDPVAAFAATLPGATSNITWPVPSTTGTTENIDDLLHSAVNSRGGFFSAADPKTFADRMSRMLSDLVNRQNSSSTSAAASSSTLQSDTLLYTAGFRSTDWSGELLARNILRDADNNLYLNDTPAWNAETILATQATRNIFTSSRSSIDSVTQTLSSGISLSAGGLHNNQQEALKRNTSGTLDNLLSERVAWLRGAVNNHASLRNRQFTDTDTTVVTRLLGDIINSNPQYAGKRDFGYRRLGDITPSYQTFRSSSAYLNRPDVLYVGTNDGMLHAFDALDGEEHFAYIPSELLLPEGSDTFARINRLMEPNYSSNHRYFMDGTPTIADAFIGGAWKTILVGTMGAGGRTVFALDVTNPSSFGASNVLWEFTDPGLGYGVSKPTIARMSDGEWVAIFGNGYNSTGHRARLYIVRLSDGAELATIDTGTDADTAASPNGLAEPTVVLDMNTLRAKTVYAGDLKGNLWRFDVTGNSTDWEAFDNRDVLFQARDANGVAQPITSAPEVAVNPADTSTLMVLFGTGSYFRNQDGGNSQIQSLYGIIDDNGAEVAGRGQLTGQSITWQGPFTANNKTYTLREVSDNALGENDGWYLDLIYNNVVMGERVISKPVLQTGALRDRVRFTTMIPEPDPCALSGGRRGFIMDIMIATGGRAPSPVFDLNGDSDFTDADIPAACEGSCGGLEFGGGEQVIVIKDGEKVDQLCSGEGECVAGSGSGMPRGRQSWRQLR
ncbi:MAG: pilus assembly protein [Gammaproteobacteria bacterium]